MEPIRVVLVDDNASFRASLAVLLEQRTEFTIVGQADGALAALDLADQLQPDLFLVDLVMPDINGIELTRQLKAAKTAPRVIVMTMHSFPAYRTVALEAGADDFLTKDEVTTLLIPAITRIFPRLRSDTSSRSITDDE